jgi:molybdopterin molybdotransferase
MGTFLTPEHLKQAHKDIRMRGFQDRTDVAAVTALIQARLLSLESEIVALGECAGRVLAADIRSEVCVPNFDRSAMDGFALIGSDTFGASAYNPLEFHIIGEALPGRAFSGIVHRGQAVRIMTGAPLPQGADAVLQAEAAEESGELLQVIEPVPPGRHVGRRGEDIEEGTIVLPRQRVLRPQDLGVLASIGQGEIDVIRRPSVEILVTGNELLPCGSRPHGYQIVDSNSVMLAALVKRDGGIVASVTLIRDNREAIRSAIHACTADVLLISGGTSVGQEDHAPSVVAELGELAVHGVALRPASPTGVGFLGSRPVFLLPGNPVSCLCAYDLFAGAAIRRLGGRTVDLPYASRLLLLARKVSSVVGRVDYVRVVIHDSMVEPLATSGASMLTSTTRADGFVLVPADSEGHAAGDEVRVFLYDSLTP